MGFGANHIINSTWHSDSIEKRQKIIFTLVIISFLYWLIGICIIVLFFDDIFHNNLFIELRNIKHLKNYIFLSSFSLVPGIIFTCWSIIQKRGLLFIFLKLAQAIAILILSIYLTLTYQNIEYLIFSKSIVSFFLSIIELCILLNYAKLKFSIKIFTDAITLSFSFLVRNLFAQLKLQFDRLFISYLYGPSQFVLYAYSAKINNIFLETSEHFQNSYNPTLYHNISKSKGSKKLNFIFFTWSILIIYTCSLFMVFGSYFIDWISNSLLIDALPLMNFHTCIIILSLPFIGNFEILVNYKKTKFLLFTSVIHGIVTISFGYVFITKFGLIGGALSIWLSNLFANVIYYLKKQSITKIYFIEKTLFPYVIIYHMSFFAKYLGYHIESFIIILLMLIAITFKYYNKYGKNIFDLFNQLKNNAIKDLIRY